MHLSIVHWMFNDYNFNWLCNWFYVSELNLIPEIINFTNEVGLTDYFINSLEGMKENE